MFLGSQSSIKATCYHKMLRHTTPLYLCFPCFLIDCTVLSSSLLKINQTANLTSPAPTQVSIQTQWGHPVPDHDLLVPKVFLKRNRKTGFNCMVCRPPLFTADHPQPWQHLCQWALCGVRAFSSEMPGCLQTKEQFFFSFSSPTPNPKSRYEAPIRDMPAVNSIPHRHGSDNLHNIPEEALQVPPTVWNWFHMALS